MAKQVWIVDPNNPYSVIETTYNHQIASTEWGETPHDKSIEDAKVISAAPDMVNALIDLVDNGFTDKELATRWGWHLHAITNARKALVKSGKIKDRWIYVDG